MTHPTDKAIRNTAFTINALEIALSLMKNIQEELQQHGNNPVKREELTIRMNALIKGLHRLPKV